MQPLHPNCPIDMPIGLENPTQVQPDEEVRAGRGTITLPRNTFSSVPQWDNDYFRRSQEPLATEHSQNGSGVPEEVQGTGSQLGSVKRDDCSGAGVRSDRRAVLTFTKSTGEALAKTVETLAKSVPVEPIASELVESTPAALAEEASSSPVGPLVAVSGGPLVNNLFDPTHGARIESVEPPVGGEENKRPGNAVQVPQPTRTSELQSTGTSRAIVPEPALVVEGLSRNEGALTAILGECAAAPHMTWRLLPEFPVDPISVSPEPSMDFLHKFFLARPPSAEPITMVPVTESVAETATKSDIGLVSDMVPRSIVESVVGMHVAPRAAFIELVAQRQVADSVQSTVSSIPRILDTTISRTPSLSILPAVTSPHMQLGENVGPIPQENLSKPDPSPIAPRSRRVDLKTARQAPTSFSKPPSPVPSPRSLTGFLRTRSLPKLFRSFKYKVLFKKSSEEKTPDLLEAPSSPVRPSLEDATTQAAAPLALSLANNLCSLSDRRRPQIPTPEDHIEDGRGDCESLSVPLPNTSTPPATNSEQPIQGLQSSHSASQLAYRRMSALRSLELQQIREDEREVARLRGGGCCGGGGKTVDPTPHQTGPGLPLPTEKPPVAPTPLVAPPTPKPGELPQGDPARSRKPSQAAARRSRAPSHVSQRTNPAGVESRSRRGSQATLKEGASVSRQPSQREARSRTASHAEPRSRKQSRVGEPGTSSQPRGARSRTASQAPGVPPVPPVP